MAQGRFIVRAQESEEQASRFSHPWNPKSEIFGTRLASRVGLSRVGVNRVRIPPGKESFVYHSHYREEEWIYVLSGRGVVEIGDEEIEIGAGDFVGFPAPQVAHHLRNPSEEEDLVYLVGGEVLDVEVADFPRLGRRMVRRGQDVEVYDVSDARGFGPLEE
ncbi:MAG TPA: cupin domain-containing protein [Rubrobacteraceae bacterium]|nr:cupin domain-containing protein [Rubrobacteraceae bacterium]